MTLRIDTNHRLCAALVAAAVSIVWQVAPVAGQTMRAGSSLSADRVVDRDGVIELTFSRDPARAGAVAVFVGDTDVTDLFERTAAGMRGSASALLLSAGETELTVWLVEDAEWAEIGRFPLVVTGRFGFQPARIDPSMTVGFKNQVAKDDASPGTDPRIDVQLAWVSQHERRDMRIETRATVVGVGDRGQALRAARLGDDAPRFDLSSYSVQANGGPLSLSLGHVSVGNQRYLINNFASRGVAARMAPDERVSLAVGVTGGSSIVGYDDLVGMHSPDHRVVTGALGIEAFSEPGRLRVELTGMRGSVQPVAGFNQGVVDDAERSRGFGLNVTVSALDRRLRLDAGLVRSRFDNPVDPLLEQGEQLVAVREETRSAQYVQASLDAVRALPLWGTRTARASFGYRHERVDPQYRSVTAYAAADRLENSVSAQIDIANIGIQAGHGVTRNNLDDVPSILTTDTRRSDAQVRAPLARIAGLTTQWLPTIGLQWSRTHQEGRDVPVNGGFDASHVPDQVSIDRTASADWNWSRAGFGVRWNRSHQDNRQTGRENADLVNTRLTATMRWSPGSRLSLTADVVTETAESVERDELDHTFRYGVQATLRLFTRTSLSLRFSDTTDEDNARTRVRGNTSLDVQLSSVLPLLDRFGGEWFARWSLNRSERMDVQLDQDDRTDRWSADTGLSLRFF
jgi:hypothetical protein